MGWMFESRSKYYDDSEGGSDGPPMRWYELLFGIPVAIIILPIVLLVLVLNIIYTILTISTEPLLTFLQNGERFPKSNDRQGDES